MMKLITQNPFRILGLYAEASLRAVSQRNTMFNAFLSAGRFPSTENDVILFGPIERTKETIDYANAEIGSSGKKFFHALFWFVKHNHIDGVALNYLQAGDIQKALSIWKQVVRNGEVSSKNYGSVQNLGSLMLAQSFEGSTIDIGLFTGALRLKIDFLASECIHEYAHLVNGQTFKANADELLDEFINGVLDSVRDHSPNQLRQIGAVMGRMGPKIRAKVNERLTEGPKENILKEVSKSHEGRTSNKRNGLKLGKALVRNTKEDLQFLENVMEQDDFQLKRIADSVAKEVLQCGIDYFIELRENESSHAGDLGNDVMSLFQAARTIAKGSATVDRISENMNSLQEWIDSADERRKQEAAGEFIVKITNNLKAFQNLSETIENADNLASGCRPILARIQSALGANDELYVKLSSAVVMAAMGMVVRVINSAQEMASGGRTELWLLNAKVSSGLKVLKKLSPMDMEPSLRRHFNENYKTLRNLETQIQKVFNQNASDSACYIATMAYGHPYHPGVVALRAYRDQTLRHSLPGRWFISFYYAYSPALVRRLQNRPRINWAIRWVLDYVVKNVI